MKSKKLMKNTIPSRKSVRNLSNVDNINNNADINSCDVVASTTKSLNKGMKAMKTLLILLLGFYLCWLPLIIYFLTFAGQNYKNSTIYILMFVACCNAVIGKYIIFQEKMLKN
jgi:hypothetical protein